MIKPKYFTYHGISDRDFVIFSVGKKFIKIEEIHKHFDGNTRLLHIEEKFQRWFIETYPKYFSRIVNLIPKLEKKFSHLVMTKKFGLFDD